MKTSLRVLPVLLTAAAIVHALAGCSRPQLVPQSMSGVYFSEEGDALVVHPAGSVNMVPSANGPNPMPSGPHYSSSAVSTLPDGTVVLSLPSHPASAIAGARVELSLDGSSASVDWSSTPLSARGRESYSR